MSGQKGISDEGEATQRSLEMKALLISFVVGLLVGVVYGMIRVKRPAPPIIALVGLLGMVLGEQLGDWILTKKINVTHAASDCLAGKTWDHRSTEQSVVSTQHNAGQ
jgi:XapX domain-containing protein